MKAGPDRTATVRERATAVEIRDGNVLLVHEEGTEGFRMPGGDVESGKPLGEAVAREFREETGLAARAMEHLFDYVGPITWRGFFNRHRVCRVQADGDVVVGAEIDAFLWWDRQEQLPLFHHVTAIPQRLDGHE